MLIKTMQYVNFFEKSTILRTKLKKYAIILMIGVLEMEKKTYKEANKLETETTINVLYHEKIITIYTNKVDLQKKLNKLLGAPTREYKTKRSITGSSWDISMDDKSIISKLILKANIFEI